MQTLNYRAEGLRRDVAIIALVQRHSVITSDLIQLALTREHLDLPGQSTALLKRLATLADRGYFHRLGRSRTGHIAYGLRRPRKGVQAQIEHDLIGSRFGVHLDIAVANRDMAVANLVGDRKELEALSRKEEWHFVPDAIFTLQDVCYFCEWDNNTEGDDKILSKIEAYKSYVRRERQRKDILEKLGEKVNTFFRVLWITTSENRAEKLVAFFEGNLHRVISETKYAGNAEEVLRFIL